MLFAEVVFDDGEEEVEDEEDAEKDEDEEEGGHEGWGIRVPENVHNLTPPLAREALEHSEKRVLDIVEVRQPVVEMLVVDLG